MSRPSRRPTRTINLIVDHTEDGTPIHEPFVVECGRRAGLHTAKSQTSAYRRAGNRRDRHATRAQLHRDPDSVELHQPRGRALWLAL
jgi:hypothetical protein